MRDPSAGVRERTSSIQVPFGLFMLRYIEAAPVDAPAVVFAPTPGHERLLRFLPLPGASANGFEKPGDFIVIASQGNAELQISVRATRPGASLDARLELENLQRAPGAGRREPAAPVDSSSVSAPANRRGSDDWSAPLAQAAAAISNLTVVGHVARRGNVQVSAGEWIAGPLSPAPIEGLTLQGSCARWVDTQVMIAGESHWMPWQAADRFAGTQGQARPLTGIRLRMSAEAPADLELHVSALFLGSPALERAGRLIELRSAAGLDPLVGFQLGFKRERSDASKSVQQAAALAPPKSGNGRVRIFRAGVERLHT